jgi:hypothetical protein
LKYAGVSKQNKPISRELHLLWHIFHSMPTNYRLQREVPTLMKVTESGALFRDWGKRLKSFGA